MQEIIKLASLIWLLMCISGMVIGQSGAVEGYIKQDGAPMTGVSVALLNTPYGTITDDKGQFELAGIPLGEYTLQASFLGYRTQSQSIQLKEGETAVYNMELQEDVLRLENIVVSATRNAVPAHRAPVIVNRIDDRIFEQTQSLSLSEGLNFSPGLRLENNCQNCGFTQLRMNGLDGPYTQILINSRPIFSALAGVYGLEMIPSNMVERVEVVRGGGSALFGGNAIAGTVNIITKDPLNNSFAIGSNLAYINGEAPDRTISANGSIVDEKLQKGLNFYAFNRSREPWDANGDEFSEITQLENTTFGMDAFFNPSKYSKVKLNIFSISEFRRGGNRFDLPPHQTDVTEQLDHRILGGSISYERFSKDYKHKISAYTSLTQVDRQSYYGGGGRVLSPQDTLTPEDLIAINAYGQSEDISVVGGVQYAYEVAEDWMLTAGGEFQYNDVLDEMPGYDRQIDQQVGTLGSYAQLQWQPSEKWSFLVGGRYDHLNIDGLYVLGSENFTNERNFGVFVPRATAMYFIQPNLKLRLSYAQGYRAPQAFDEDLHIETVGGAALFTRLDPELEMERSNSYNVSLDYTHRKGRFESNFVIDGFYTYLNNPFITANQTELPSGVAVITKRNGEGALVAGTNLEANLAFSSKLIVQMGATLQAAVYDEAEEIWAPESVTDANQDSIITSKNILRTPNAYGFLTATWTPLAPLSLSASGIFTGAMEVPHVIDPDSEYTILERTPTFFETNLKATYEFSLSDEFHLDLSAGVQNLFNSFQEDFDTGADRDAGYIYGPVRPRTVFVGVKIHFN
jgi:outer membrane receptor for ferrienterochelin and colicins